MAGVYYQSTDFTCGPACLLLALQLLLGREPNRLEELQIWREANTVYMGEGIPGTSAYGLALAALKRGLETEIHDFDHAHLFATHQGERSDEEQDVLLKTLKSDEARYHTAQGAVFYRRADMDLWRARLREGWAAIVLAMDEDGEELHWVLATAMDDLFVTVYDPYPYPGKAPARGAAKRMPVTDFWRWIHHDEQDYQTVLFLRKPQPGEESGVPYLTQQTDFTCGPACLMVALGLLKPGERVVPLDEYLIWRRSNTVYMVEGHPGCGPYGLAVVAKDYGLPAAVRCRNLKALFLLWNEENLDFGMTASAIMEHDQRLAEACGVPVGSKPFALGDLRRLLRQGKVLMLLDVSVEAGHWILLLGEENGQWRVHDPLLDPDDPGDKPQKVFQDEEIAGMMVCPRTQAQCLIVLG